MSEAEGGQEPAPTPAPQPKKRRRWVGVLVAFLAIVVLIAVAASFIPPGPTWQHVATFSGFEPERPLETDTFNVTGSMFRMKWTVTEADCDLVPDVCATTFQFQLFEAGTTSYLVRHVIIGPELGRAAFTGENMVQGGGSFYLLVIGGNWVDSWTIVIEEWK